jgi:hypothetical protein
MSKPLSAALGGTEPAVSPRRSRWCNEDALDSFSRLDRSDAFLAAAPPDVVSNERGDMGPLSELSKHSSGDSRPPPGVVGAAQDLARLVPQGKAMTTDLRSAAEVVGLLQEQVTELLGRALEVVENAYACPEWLRYGRTERTNKTRALLLDAVLSQVAEGGPDE